MREPLRLLLPDTLAAGPAAAAGGGMLLLVDGQDAQASGGALMFLRSYQVDRAWIAGGPDVVAPDVRVGLERTQ